MTAAMTMTRHGTPGFTCGGAAFLGRTGLNLPKRRHLAKEIVQGLERFLAGVLNGQRDHVTMTPLERRGAVFVEEIDEVPEGATVVCSHEMQIYLASRGVESIGMNKGGRVEAAGIGLTMVHAEHSGGVTVASAGTEATREVGCWGWLLEFEDGTRVYHTGDTDLFGDMALVKDRWAPTIAVLPIGGHYTMGPREAALAIELLGVQEVLPIHYGTFPILTGTPNELRIALAERGLDEVNVHSPEPGGVVER